MFIVLSSEQGQCESSVSSFNEMQTKHHAAANPQTKPTNLGFEAATDYQPHCCHLLNYYSARRLILI